MISVIVIVGTIPPEFERFRRCIHTAEQSIEIIYVVNKGLEGSIKPLGHQETVLVSNRAGRGYAMAQGARRAHGDIMLLLHADTLLPKQWDNYIRQTLSDASVVGGAFNLRFDKENAYLRLLVILSDVFFHATGELWGDRAIFIRSDVLRQNLSVIDVPILEDVRLSLRMKQLGSVRLINAAVRTASDSFHRRGMVRHTMRILLCRSLYTLGIPLKYIWRCYYGSKQ